MGLAEVLKACREYGVKTIDWYGIKVEFGPDPSQPMVVMQDTLKPKIGVAYGAPTDDEMLYWSSDKELPDIEASQPT